MKKIVILSLAAVLGLVACTEQPEEITDINFPQLLSPANLEVSVQKQTKAILTWETVDNAAGYELKLYNAEDLGNALREDETDKTTYTFEGLTEDLEYEVHVRANGSAVPQSKWTVIKFDTKPIKYKTLEWNFSDEEFDVLPATLEKGSSYTIRGLEVIAGNNTMARNASAKTYGDIAFTYRVNTGGASVYNVDDNTLNARLLHIVPDSIKAGVMEIYTQSNGTDNRVLQIISKDNKVVGELGTPSSALSEVGVLRVPVTDKADYYVFAKASINIYMVRVLIGAIYEVDASSTLKMLAVTGETLSPAFNPDIFEYTLNVPYSTEEITITATKNHVNQTVEGDGTKALATGATLINEFTVRVTAEDGEHVKGYNIVVNRAAAPSNDATLKTLTASPGNLTPAFDPAVTEYNVTTTAEKVTITADASHKFAKVGDNGSFEADNLVVGVPSIVTIPVLAEELTTKIYTVTVTRQEAPSGGGPTTKMWNFSDAVFQTLPASFTTDYTIDGLQIIAGGSEMRYNANGKSMDGYVFTHRLQYNGAGDITKRALKFDVEGPSTITAYMITGSGTDVRELVVHDGTNELGRLATDGTSNINKYVHNYTGGAGSIYIYSLAGINIYGLKVETISGGGSGGGGDDGGNSAWTKVDIGANSGGDKSVSGGILTLTGKGKWESSDQSFTYLYMQKTGDFTATVRVQNYTTTAAANNAGQAGLLLTSDITQTGNNFLHMQAGVQNGFAATVYSRRLTTDINASRGTITAGGTGSDYVLKLVRSGTSISLYASKDGGVTYGNASTQTIASLSESVYIGVAVNSNSNSDTGTATFSDFKIDDTPMPFE
jgi:hypothetical protein